MDVLAGNEAGQRTAKEGAHGAKLLGLAEAPGRDAVHLPPPRFLVAYVIALHGHAGHLLLPVGVKSLRQKVVDRHVIASDIERDAFNHPRPSGAGPGGPGPRTPRLRP